MWVIKILLFVVAVIIGVEAASFVRYKTVSLEQEMEVSRNHKSPFESKVVEPFGCHRGIAKDIDVDDRSEFILAKPRAEFTEVARNKGTQGTVRLKVALLASGHIGAIQVIDRLPDGLTEQALAAARKIEFKPKIVNGRPQSVSRIFEYKFTIH